jgi:hypothetical protein
MWNAAHANRRHARYECLIEADTCLREGCGTLVTLFFVGPATHERY